MARIPDPLELFREAVNRLEAGANSLANRKLTNSQQLVKSLSTVAMTSMGLQRVLERALAGAFALLDIPSRTQLAAQAVALQRVEDKLDLLLGASVKPAVVRLPARTRKPPPVAPPVAPAVAAAKSPAKSAPQRRRKGAAR